MEIKSALMALWMFGWFSKPFVTYSLYNTWTINGQAVSKSELFSQTLSSLKYHIKVDTSNIYIEVSY